MTAFPGKERLEPDSMQAERHTRHGCRPFGLAVAVMDATTANTRRTVAPQRAHTEGASQARTEISGSGE